MENIKVGDILIDRDTRRVGRKLKVIWVDSDSVTAEVISDSLNAKKSSVGNSTDIARNRLKKGYTLGEDAKFASIGMGTLDTTTINSGSISTPKVEAPVQEDNDILNDTGSLEEALNSAGYHWLPPVEDLVGAVKDEAENLTKSGLVVLVHEIIKRGLTASN